MANYITRIRTESGDLPIDYNALANLPIPDTTLDKSGSFADAKAVGDQIDSINARITQIQGGDALAGVTINGKKLSDNPQLTLSASDVGAAPTVHEHKMSDIKSGVLSITQGGTNSSDGSTGLKNLLAAGAMILSDYQYGTSAKFETLKEQGNAAKGQIFFVRV